MSKLEGPDEGGAEKWWWGSGWREWMAGGAIGMALWAVGYAGCQSSKPGGRDWSNAKPGSGSALLAARGRNAPTGGSGMRSA